MLLEATLWLAIARFAITVLSFRQVGHLAARPIRRSQPSPQAGLIKATPVVIDRLTGEVREAQIFVAVMGASNSPTLRRP